MNKITAEIRVDEFAMLQIMRQFKGDFADFKVEYRDGKITRILPTFSYLVKDVNTPLTNKESDMI